MAQGFYTSGCTYVAEVSKGRCMVGEELGPPHKGAAEDSAPAAKPSSPRARRAAIAAAVTAVVSSGFGIYAVAQHANSPESAVEDFFEAVIDKDVEAALDLVDSDGFGPPYAERAEFLHPDAIAEGWELLDATANPHRSGGGAVVVQIVAGVSEDDTTNGSIQVTEVDGQWKLVDPFVTVDIVSSPLTYMQVNDHVVDVDELHGHDLHAMFGGRYDLFPGVAAFFADVPGVEFETRDPSLLLPSSNPHGEVPRAVLPNSSFPADTQLAAQEAVEEVVDECVTFQTLRPPHCPFGSRSGLDDGEHHVKNLREAEWTIEQYPRVSLFDPGVHGRDAGLTFVVDDPGSIRMSAKGSVDGEGSFDVVADCEVAAEPLRAALTRDGEVDLHFVRRVQSVREYDAYSSSNDVETCELDEFS